jgi:hypothetical protein
MLGVAILLLTLFLLKMGWCSCTLFAVNSWVMIGSAVLLLGNRSFGVLAEEKEKKTLDCLRLTQLSPSSLFWYKLSPEFRSLARLLLFLTPSVLLSSLYSASGLGAGLGVVAIATLGGTMSIISSLFVSSLAANTSRAVVQGWTLKACWLLLTPVFDLVVSAVTVTTQRYPVFDAINPFAAAWPLVVPEAELGLRQHLPLAFLALGVAACWAMWTIAARRYEQGLIAAPTLTDRQIHKLYRQTPSWIPGWLGVRDNPIFLRELAAQLRSGAGKWPGYAVFITLFLAPFLYSNSWNQRRSSEIELRGQTQLRASQAEPQTPVQVGSPASPVTTTPFIRLHSWDGTELRLNGHTNCTCLRMELYNRMHVPLPASAIVKVEYRDPLQGYVSNGETPPRPGPAEVQLSTTEAQTYGVATAANPMGNAELSADTQNQIRLHSMAQGLMGCLVLLSLYLGVRCSGFLANAVTSECDRRSWTDLALTGLSPEQVLQGKLAGTLLMPVIQLLVAAPSLLLFVAAGAMSPLGFLQLVSYAALLAVAAGLVGFWASSASRSSHSAQGLALAAVMGWLVVTPVLVGVFGRSLMLPLLGLALIASTRRVHLGVVAGWMAVAAAAFFNPLGLSPWTCLPSSMMCGPTPAACLLTGLFTWLSGVTALVGLSSVCYFSTLANLQQPGQGDTLCADRVA